MQMPKTTYCLAIAGTLFLAFGAHAADRIGVVEYVEGTVTATDVESRTETLVVDSPVYEGDRIVTADKAKIQIRFLDGTLLTQGEQSDFRIDEYVFTPDQPQGNGTVFDFIQGIFRVMTGKITELNPERFRVRTHYGTVGIRGCDLGFNLNTSEDRVFVIDLHHADSVWVALRKAYTGTLPKDAIAEQDVREGGQLVILSPQTGLSVRRFSGQELFDLIRHSTPYRPDAQGLQPEGRGVAHRAIPKPPEVTPTPDSAGRSSRDDDLLSESLEDHAPAGDDSPIQQTLLDAPFGRTGPPTSSLANRDQTASLSQILNKVNEVVEDVVAADPDDAPTVGGIPILTEPPTMVTVNGIPTGNDPTDDSPSLPNPPNPQPPGIIPPSNPLPPTPPPSGPTPPPAGDDPNFPIVGPTANLAGGSGDGWSWDLWSREVIELDPVTGLPVNTTEFGTDTGGSQLSATEVDAIAAGATALSLSGVGSAAAAVFQGPQQTFMNGVLQLSVDIGGGNNSWDSAVTLGAGGNALNFEASGVIAGGSLTGGLDSYSLDAFGTSHGAGTLSRQDIDARLVGPGTGADPITGGTLEFEFEHGPSGPSVVGAGGVDL